MKLPQPPPQVSRLVLLLLGIIGTYAAARHLLTPETFGEYGHYRGAALRSEAAREPRFAGAAACSECHGDTEELLAKDKHRSIRCESCHGPARGHAGNPELSLAKVEPTLCIRCHVADPARPASQRQIVLMDHNPGESCIECHLPHQPNKSP